MFYVSFFAVRLPALADVLSVPKVRFAAYFIMLCHVSMSLVTTASCFLHVVFSTAGFKGGGKPCPETLKSPPDRIFCELATSTSFESSSAPSAKYARLNINFKVQQF